MASSGIRDRVAIVGMGCTSFGEHWDRFDGFVHVAFYILNELRAAITPQTAAILVVPVQGEGGIRPASLDGCASATAVNFGSAASSLAFSVGKVFGAGFDATPSGPGAGGTTRAS